ncbi:MAG: hypothetical protein GF393_10780 [Armatimonadia bacterium]|nr:hypothetical protein [Armatimonadia bacterium]
MAGEDVIQLMRQRDRHKGRHKYWRSKARILERTIEHLLDHIRRLEDELAEHHEGDRLDDRTFR